MTAYTSISIGINSYYNFQPLSYAIADAEGLVQCLEDHVNLDPQQSLLLTDLSPRIGKFSTYPSRENILHWLDPRKGESSQTPLNASSVLWFFFSGYGLHYQGEDYLIPIDGDPQDLPNTAIPVRSVFTLLQQQGAGKIVAVFDMNRSPGMLGEIGVGEQTFQLAGKMGIACILSAHPHQVSHEAASLGHGIFTCALLEALKYYRRDLTLENLDHYLYDRLPELSEHHWRPIQNHLFVLPIPEAAQASVLPALVSSGMVWHNLAQITLETSVNSLNHDDGQKLTSVAVISNGTPQEINFQVETHTLNGNAHYEPTLPQLNGNNITTLSQPELQLEEKPDLPRAKRQIPVKKIQPTWTKFLTNNHNIFSKSVIGIVVIILGLFGFNKIITQFNLGDNSITEPNSNTNNTNNTNNNTTEIPNLQVRENPQTSTIDSEGKQYLQQAKASFRNYQASNFSSAIDLARQVPENDPYYAQAQADIYRWSQNIWDVAQSRANQGNFPGAIAAAKLIPSDQQQLYTEAQNQIKEWEAKTTEQKTNNELLRQAKKLINPRQASSYIKAMQLLEKIKEGETGYPEAQSLRQQWSRQVYLIANSRASRGKFELAIKTALLVPQDSNSYQDAQTAIARWQQGKR